MSHEQITVSPLPVTLPKATQRDARGVDRSWRIFKAVHLARTDWVLARLLGRPL